MMKELLHIITEDSICFKHFLKIQP